MIRFIPLALLSVCCVGQFAEIGSADDWTRFRGANGEGKSDLKGVPTTWTEDDYEWVIDLPGKGHSSPAIWGEQLFVTTGESDGSRTLHCLNAMTGQPIWKDTLGLDANHLHKKNSYASGTPVVDGKHVVVAFADAERYTLLAYNLNGERQWSQDIGAFSSQHGQGVSPIIYEGKVIVPSDQMGPSKVVALNVESGAPVWTSERNFRKTSYATPMVIEVEGKPQLICLSGAVGLAGLNPSTGEELWHSGEMPQRTVGSPVYGNGLLIGSSGSGGRGKYMAVVDPTEGGKVAMVRTQNLPYVPTPIIHEGHLFLWNDDGVVCCVDLAGDIKENLWRERVGGNFSGSPVLIDEKLYCISEEGEIVVIDAKPKFHLYGKSPLGDQSYATPAVANSRVYFRGFHSLACLKAKK